MLGTYTYLSAKYCVATSPIGSLDSTTLAPLWWILSSLSYRIDHSASTTAWYSWKATTICQCTGMDGWQSGDNARLFLIHQETRTGRLQPHPLFSEVRDQISDSTHRVEHPVLIVFSYSCWSRWTSDLDLTLSESVRAGISHIVSGSAVNTHNSSKWSVVTHWQASVPCSCRANLHLNNGNNVHPKQLQYQ